MTNGSLMRQQGQPGGLAFALFLFSFDFRLIF